MLSKNTLLGLSIAIATGTLLIQTTPVEAAPVVSSKGQAPAAMTTVAPAWLAELGHEFATGAVNCAIAGLVGGAVVGQPAGAATGGAVGALAGGLGQAACYVYSSAMDGSLLASVADVSSSVQAAGAMSQAATGNAAADAGGCGGGGGGGGGCGCGGGSDDGYTGADGTKPDNAASVTKLSSGVRAAAARAVASRLD